MIAIDWSSPDFHAAFWTIVVAIVGNVSCAILGCYLVLRRLSLLGDAISHGILPGIAVAFLLSGRVAVFPMFLGAMIVGVLTAFFTQALHSVGKVPEDASMGVVFTSLFALGVLLISNVASRVDLDPGCVLYGLIEFVPMDTVNLFGFEIPRALESLGLALAATLLFTLVFWKELKIVSFDPGLATAMGINAVVMHYLLMAMVAGVTVAAFEAVGSILVIAMLIVPAATAQLLTDDLNRMMLVAVGVGVISAIGGYVAAVPLDTSVAGMMAVVAGAQFFLAYFFAPRYGLISRVAHNLWLSARIVGEDVIAWMYRDEELGSASPASGRECVARAGGGPMGWFAVWRLLRRHLLVRVAGGGFELSVQGRKTAQSLVRSHRLWERFLEENFDLPLDHLHAPASRIEHFIGPDLQARLAEELEEPGKDPHGRAIPPRSDPTQAR